MKRISFNRQFVNEAGDNLVPGKIHTIRQNYDYWKHFEGQDVACFTWEGKPYRSKQKVFCTKKLVSVQQTELRWASIKGVGLWFTFNGEPRVSNSLISQNDGFGNYFDFLKWFDKYPAGDMAILHFTDFRY
jgi:hypothetical protein